MSTFAIALLILFSGLMASIFIAGIRSMMQTSDLDQYYEEAMKEGVRREMAYRMEQRHKEDEASKLPHPKNYFTNNAVELKPGDLYCPSIDPSYDGMTLREMVSGKEYQINVFPDWWNEVRNATGPIVVNPQDSPLLSATKHMEPPSRDRHYCPWCGNYSKLTDSGCCCSCGAPHEPPQPRWDYPTMEWRT